MAGILTPVIIAGGGGLTVGSSVQPRIDHIEASIAKMKVGIGCVGTCGKWSIGLLLIINVTRLVLPLGINSLSI